MKSMLTRRAVPALLLALLMAGCAASNRLYVNPQADMSFYKKVAVLPFGNLSQQTYAGERVTRGFMTELIMTDRFQVVEPAEFSVVLERTGGTPGASGVVPPDKLRQACTEVGATGVIRGAVTEYQMIRAGQDEFPVLSFDAELLDVASGNVVWRISVSRRGKGRMPVLGGTSTRSFGALTQQACREAVAALRGKAF